MAAPSASTVLYFFCDHRDPSKQSIRDFLHVIIKQLLDQDINCFADANAWRHEKTMGTLSAAKPLVNSEYIDIIRRMCSRRNTVSIVVDALDECTDLNTFVEDLVTLKAISNIRLLLTSRHDIEVVRVIQPIAQHTISISDYMRNDIKIYLETEINSRVGQRSLKLRESWLKAEIATSLEAKADGL
jgi:amino acid transporter